jgi:hypothetical protein
MLQIFKNVTSTFPDAEEPMLDIDKDAAGLQEEQYPL